MTLQAFTDASFKHLFPKNCFDVLVNQHDFVKDNCGRMVMSRVASILVTSISTLVYFPQFVKILNSGSSVGISRVSVLMSIAASAGTAAYGFHRNAAFSAYGDAVFLAIQQCLLLAVSLYFSVHSAYAFSFLTFCWASMFGLIGSFVPMIVLKQVYNATLVFNIFSKMLQLHANYKNKSTGQLSLLSMFLATFVEMGRIVTKRHDTLAQLTARSIALATALGILWQFRRYGRTEIEASKASTQVTATKRPATKPRKAKET